MGKLSKKSSLNRQSFYRSLFNPLLGEKLPFGLFIQMIHYDIKDNVLRNRVNDITNKTIPIPANQRNCGQIISIPAPR